MSNKRTKETHCSCTCKITRKFVNKVMVEFDLDLWTTGKGHYLLVSAERDVKVFFAKTPSNHWRNLRNIKAELRRQGVVCE